MRAVWPELAGLSFPDETVHRWDIDPERSWLGVGVSDAHLAAAGGMLSVAIELLIGPWSAFRGQRFLVGAEARLVTDPAEPLREICECGFGPSSAWLAGFGAWSGDWLRYEFTGAVVARWPQEA